jgi:hypothetical protein
LISTEFLRFFDLYPKQGGLLTVQVDKGTFATIEALFASPLLFWTTAMMLPLLLTCLWCACITLCRAIRDPAVLAVLFVMVYYMAIAGGPGDWGRFRHPAMPILCLLAAYSLCRESTEGRSTVTSIAATDTTVDECDDNRMQPRSMRLPLLESEE